MVSSRRDSETAKQSERVNRIQKASLARGFLLRIRATGSRPTNPDAISCLPPRQPRSGVFRVYSDQLVLLVLIHQAAQEDVESLVAAPGPASDRGSSQSSSGSRRRSGSCLSTIFATMPLRSASMGPLIAPTFRSNSCGATWPTSPTSGTWPSQPTRSLVFTVAPTSLAALARSLYCFALSASSWVFSFSSAGNCSLR